MQTAVLSVFLVAVCLPCGYSENRLLNLNTPEQYMDICLDGKLHKTKPGPESALFQKCSPWKERSCCTEDITQQLHINDTWYKMNWNHCPQRLSDKCRAHFIQDTCFYECSPNVGPWLVKISGVSWRNERFMGVPLCQTECNAWWEDCKDDYTCIENWSRGFNWTSGSNKCPNNAECRTFQTVYKTANRFCEVVYDHSWKVVDDSDPGGCFLMWWQDSSKNPNYNVALKKAQIIVSSASTFTISNIVLCLQSLILMVWFLR